jgi:transcriptional regulator with XRE-family HTH domain
VTHRQEVGARIAQARREKGVRERRDILRADLATAVGVDPSTITAWEKGQKSPREEVLAKLADYLGVTPSFLRYGIKPDTITVAGLEIDRASLVRFSDAELAEAVRKIAEEEAQAAAEKAVPAPARKAANGKKRRPPR